MNHLLQLQGKITIHSATDQKQAVIHHEASKECKQSLFFEFWIGDANSNDLNSQININDLFTEGVWNPEHITSTIFGGLYCA